MNAKPGWLALVILLTGCATVPKPPIAPSVITAETVRYVPIPSELSADCPIPSLTDRTVGGAIEFAIILKSALIACNGQLASIRAIQGAKP